MMDLYITVSAKWHPEKKTKYGTLLSGWICKSSNPEIETGRYKSYDSAFEAFTTELKEQWSETFENYPQIHISSPEIKGKTERFTAADGVFSFVLSEDEVSISWLITIARPLNRTLDEFESSVVDFKNTLQDMKGEGVTVTFVPAASQEEMNADSA